MNGTSKSSTFDGRCEKTMVFSRPNRAPTRAATIDEPACSRPPMNATTLMSWADAPNLRSNQNVFVHLDDVNDVVLVRGTAVEIKPSRELGEALAAAMHAKYPDYEPTPDSWDGGGMWRIEPEAVIAWTTMPTSTRWRFGSG